VDLHPRRLVVELDDSIVQAPLSDAGSVQLGPLSVDVDQHGGSVAWSVANRGDASVRVRSVGLVHGVEPSGRLRMLRHGYQSWSRTAVATLGVDHDPSTVTGSIEMVRGMHHADQRRAADGELRSEWVTVLADESTDLVLAGFDAGATHDGTWRLRETDGGVELTAEAFLGDAVLEPGTRRDLHPHEVRHGDDAPELLDQWAMRVGRAASARVAEPYQVGWCSWYHYFHNVTEAHLRANLALADDWPFDVFQLDDGYQAAIGDWLETNEKFPSNLGAIASRVEAAGRRPGIWIAPFIVAPDSRIAVEHPEWLATFRNGRPLWGMFNPEWGGGLDGIMYALDTTNTEVQAHLEDVGRSLVNAGFTYVKLDFTFAPSFDGVWSDATRTPAERVRAGFDAIRRGVGDGTFLLGCGAPLSNVVGVVDGNRIGPDVAPSWERTSRDLSLPGYEAVEPATLHAWVDTLTRSFMHRRLWLNDPDCLMLRTDETAMSPAAVETWARAVAVSGGMALVSDDLALLGEDARALLDEVVQIGREVDLAAQRGPAPRCDDLLERSLPTRLSGAGYGLEADVTTATSTLLRPR
jgi:alpha-galactosidase